MSGILLRSPIYRTVANAPTNSNSTKCTITIDGTLRYTLVKRIQPTETQVWEIAELCKDYIDITFNGTYTPETLTVVTVLTTHASIDGSGSALSTNTFPSSGNDVAYDGYGTWMQGSNPAPKSTLPNWLISGDPKYTSINNQYQIFVPAGIGGSVPYITTSSFLVIKSLLRSILILSKVIILFSSFLFVLFKIFFILKVSSFGSKGFGK